MNWYQRALVTRKIDCSVKKTEASGQYEISYQATSRGRHQLHIVLEGKHIIGSPFPVFVKQPLPGTALKAITGGYTDSGEWHNLNYPWGVAVNRRNYVSVINPAEPEEVIQLLHYVTKGSLTEFSLDYY